MELRCNFLPQFKVQMPSNITNRNYLPIVCIFPRETPAQYDRGKKVEVHCNDDENIQHDNLSQNKLPIVPKLSFGRLQLPDQECTGQHSRNFGRFVAREAILDEEYWMAAWLRAEAHWESYSNMRNVDNYKRKYADQEFYALKRRCLAKEGNSLNCCCLVAVKKEEKNVKRTVLKSIVGTLDLSIRQFVQWGTYPGDLKIPSSVLASQESFDMHKYAYVSNVVVALYARRQGIASNMLYLATDVAKTSGMKQLFVHVNTDNKPAQDLYKKTGFKVVDVASSPLSKDNRLLMSMEL